jgi:hypothetical protein
MRQTLPGRPAKHTCPRSSAHYSFLRPPRRQAHAGTSAHARAHERLPESAGTRDRPFPVMVLAQVNGKSMDLGKRVHLSQSLWPNRVNEISCLPS